MQGFWEAYNGLFYILICHIFSLYARAPPRESGEYKPVLDQYSAMVYHENMLYSSLDCPIEISMGLQTLQHINAKNAQCRTAKEITRNNFTKYGSLHTIGTDVVRLWHCGLYCFRPRWRGIHCVTSGNRKMSVFQHRLSFSIFSLFQFWKKFAI